MNKNLRNSILFRSENKLKLYQEGKKLSVTRSAVAVNPLTCYNVSTGNVMEQFANNVLTKHGEYGFIGGDTLEVSFDFGTKVASSVVECPMKAYRCYATSIKNPTDITGDINTGFGEEVLQADLDKLKTQDGTARVCSPSAVNSISQFMLELDLTPLCNQLYGGSNAALKAALKSIQADIWAMGSGSNASVLTNGVNVKFWKNNETKWGDSNNGSTAIWMNSHAIGSINKVNLNVSDGGQLNGINSSNKVYILIHATYPSDGTIPSSVSLDYPKITIQLNRTVDVVAPKTVYLPKYWAIVGKISPNFDGTDTKARRLIELYRSDNERILLNYSIGSLKAYYIVSGDTSKNTTITISFNKYQVIGFILTKILGKLKLFLLKNNDTLKSGEVLVASETYGSYPLRTLVSQDGGGTLQGDSFTDIEALYDLQSLGKPNGLTDAEAEVLLRGIQYPSTEEMVVNGGFDNDVAWTKHANAVISGGVLTLNASASYQGSYQIINVLSNQNYKLSFNKTGMYGHIAYGYFTSADVQIGGWNYIGNGTDNNYYETSVATPSNCAKIRIVCENSVSGTFTFDNISLKYSKPLGQLITAVNKELFDISKVSLHSNARIEGNGIVLNATGAWQNSQVKIPVLANNQYELKITVNTGTIYCSNFYNNISLGNAFPDKTTAGTFTFTTKANCNYIVVGVSSGDSTSGTKTFVIDSLKLKQ